MDFECDAIGRYWHPQLKCYRYWGSYVQPAAVLQPKKKVNLCLTTAFMMNFWEKKIKKTPWQSSETLVVTVITPWSLMAVPSDSTLAPFLIDVDFLGTAASWMTASLVCVGKFLLQLLTSSNFQLLKTLCENSGNSTIALTVEWLNVQCWPILSE